MDNELKHFGIKGMKWGVRRYQNKDGSLTPAGKKRYDDDDGPDSTSSTEKPKSLGETTKKMKEENDYLRAQKDRLELERDLKRLTSPQNVSNGKKAAALLYEKVVIPTLAEAAKGLTGIALKKISNYALSKNKNSKESKSGYSDTFKKAYGSYTKDKNSKPTYTKSKSIFDDGIIDADFTVKSSQTTYNRQQNYGKDYISGLLSNNTYLLENKRYRN